MMQRAASTMAAARLRNIFLNFVLDNIYTRGRDCDRIETSEKTGERTKEASYHRHDINDKVWALCEPDLPGHV